MIVYFANRNMEIMGKASTYLRKGVVIVDDNKVEDVETGVATFECSISVDEKRGKRLEVMAEPGNYLLRKNGHKNEFYTIIDSEYDSKKQEVWVYAEDAGLDLLNEIAGGYAAEESHGIEHYVEYWTEDSGFEIGINECPASTTRKLIWDGESTVTERLASIATQFGGYEISFSFEIKCMEVTHKYINIYKQRGKDTGVQLRLNREIDRIITKKSVANLATAFYCTGGIPEDSDTPITLKGYTYDDGDFFVDADGVLRSRKAAAKWSRYVWNKEPNKLDGYTGHIERTYSYNTTSQQTLCAHAITDLKKVCDMEVNYEAEFKRLPASVEIGDRVNIVDDAGELYLSSRILKLSESETRQEHTATIGEHLIKGSGISQTVKDLAAEFKEVAAAKAAALQAQIKANEIEKAVLEVDAKAEAAQGAAGQAVIDAEIAQEKAAEAKNEATAAQNLAEETKGKLETLEAKAITTDNLSAKVGEFGYLKANALESEVAKFGYAKVTDLEVTNANVKSLQAENARIEGLFANYATIDLANVKAGSITQAMIGEGVVGTAQIANGSITDAKIVELTANKITAGTLSVERLEIRGSTNSLVYALNNITGALQAQNVDTLNGEVLTPRTITADKIVAEAITANEIAASAITTNKILAGAITSDKILSGAITTDKLAANAVTAAKINVNDLFAQNITATGSITGAKLYGAHIEAVSGKIGGFNLANNVLLTEVSGVYITPGWLETVKILGYSTGSLTLTATELAASDLDGNGAIYANDAMLAYQAMKGEKKYSDYVGAKASTVTAKMDPTNPDEFIYISGTNAWGRKVESCLGINGLITDNVTAERIMLSGILITSGDVAFMETGICTNDTTPVTIFGIDNGQCISGNTDYNLKMFGSGTRPTYNGNMLALFSDVSGANIDLSDYALANHNHDSVYATKTELNKKANDFSIEIYNGTSGNPKPVRFASFNYSTCGSENGIAAKISMVSGHGNGSSYAFLQDVIIRVTHTGGVEVDNFKYYGASTGAYDGASRQYGDIFWLVDTTNKIVDFYVLMGQYARLYQTPWKRLTYSTGGTVTQHTSCTVYSSGTKAWANNSEIALVSDLSGIGGVSGDYLPLAGGTVTGHMTVKGTLSAGTGIILQQGGIILAKQYDLMGSDGIGNAALYLRTDGGVGIGQTSMPLALHGSGTRPGYNNDSLALYSDLSSYLPTAGGTLTGNLTGKYITGTWLQTTATTNLGSKPERIAVLSSGWIYYRTPAEILSDIGALPLAGGLLNGSLKFQDSSMPGKALQFVCGIDAFANGGELGWQSKADFLAGYATTAQLGSYLPLGGGTLTGALTFANGTMNTVGDDVQIGDQNVAGTLCVKGTNGATAIQFMPYNSNAVTTKIMSNDVSSYGGLRVTGLKGAYHGILFGDDNTGLNIMSCEPHQGLYNESKGKWVVYYNRTYDQVGILTAPTTESTYKIQLAGATQISGNLNATGSISEGGTALSSKYAQIATANTYNGEQKFQNSSYCPTVTDTASGVGCAFKASRGLANEMLIDKLIMTASTGKIPFYKYTGTSNGSMTGLTEVASISSAGALTVTGGAKISGRYAGGGDDEGLVVGRASNNYAGVCLGDPSGIRSVFYLLHDNSAIWKWNNGSGTYDIKHPGKSGTIALTSDISAAGSPFATLWNGNWSSGNLDVTNSSKYRLYLITTVGRSDGSTQGTTILAIRNGNYIRGIGGYENGTPTDYTYHFAATVNGDTWTFVGAGYMYHSASGSHSARTLLAVSKIEGVM